jgi:hypothetical protein
LCDKKTITTSATPTTVPAVTCTAQPLPNCARGLPQCFEKDGITSCASQNKVCLDSPNSLWRCVCNLGSYGELCDEEVPEHSTGSLCDCFTYGVGVDPTEDKLCKSLTKHSGYPVGLCTSPLVELVDDGEDILNPPCPKDHAACHVNGWIGPTFHAPPPINTGTHVFVIVNSTTTTDAAFWDERCQVRAQGYISLLCLLDAFAELSA